MTKKPWISTRGSLQSEQSQWATLFFRKHWGKLPIPQDWTLLFEIIYPENRIVINYGERQTLVLLAAIHTESAQEMPYSELQSFAQQFHFELVTRLPFSIPELCVWIPKLPYNQEGFVVHYPKSHLRVKFKGEAYLKLHKILNQITPKNIWKTMIEGKVSLPYLQEIPEEFRTWSLHLQENLESDYEKRKQEVQHLFQSLPPFSTRAQFAEHVKTKYPQFAPLLFALLDQNPKKIDFLLHKAMQPKELQESRFTDEV
jgi:RNA ligase